MTKREAREFLDGDYVPNHVVSSMRKQCREILALLEN